MNLYKSFLWSISLFGLFLGAVAIAQAETQAKDETIKILPGAPERILLAHHLGNRPDDAPNIDDNVHGGDFPADDPDSWDPGMEDQGSAPKPDNG